MLYLLQNSNDIYLLLIQVERFTYSDLIGYMELKFKWSWKNKKYVREYLENTLSQGS